MTATRAAVDAAAHRVEESAPHARAAARASQRERPPRATQITCYNSEGYAGLRRFECMEGVSRRARRREHLGQVARARRQSAPAIDSSGLPGDVIDRPRRRRLSSRGPSRRTPVVECSDGAAPQTTPPAARKRALHDDVAEVSDRSETGTVASVVPARAPRWTRRSERGGPIEARRARAVTETRGAGRAGSVRRLEGAQASRHFSAATRTTTDTGAVGCHAARRRWSRRREARCRRPADGGQVVELRGTELAAQSPVGRRSAGQVVEAEQQAEDRRREGPA